MKNNLLILILFAGTLAFQACNNEPKTAGNDSSKTADVETPVSDGEEVLEQRVTHSVATLYDMDNDNSTISWKANKKLGGGHAGTFKPSMGRLAYDQGRVVAGEVNVNMKSLDVTDDMGAGKAKLVGHLSSADFFDIEKFPSAKFVFQKIQPEADGSNGYNYTISGPLTMKGITKIISVPANIDVQESRIAVNSPVFTINRTDWGINYNSALLGTVADKIINDEVEMSFTAVFLPR